MSTLSMTLQLDEVCAKVPNDQEMAYMRQGVYHFIVLNRADNTWDADRLDRYSALLD